MRQSSFIAKFIDKFSRDQTTTMAASLAFYTALSLAPILFLFVTITSFLSEDGQSQIVAQVRSLMGQDAAGAVSMIVYSAHQQPHFTSIGSLFGLLTLVISASLIFGELRSTLNRIFEIKSHRHPATPVLKVIFDYFRGRVINVGMAFIFILSLIVSVTASSVITASVPSFQKDLMLIIDNSLSLLIYGGIFTFIYRYLPDERLEWSRALRGGFLTSLLFCIGKQLVGTYLGHSAIGSYYGAAGSIVVLLAWVYYLALITFVGAQISALLGLGHRRRTV